MNLLKSFAGTINLLEEGLSSVNNWGRVGKNLSIVYFLKIDSVYEWSDQLDNSDSE